MTVNLATANSKDENLDIGKPKCLLIGYSGSGKTSQFLTFPGKKFAYIFDPSALATLKGHDVDFMEFIPSRTNLGAVSLTKGKSDTKTAGDYTTVYTSWEKDCEARLNANFFDAYDSIMFDSFTTFSDMVMDRILTINGRAGQFPQQDDWAGQMQTITNVVRTFIGMNKYLLFTGHIEFKQDEFTKRMQNTILLTGKLRTKLPLLFSEMLTMECSSIPEGIKYQMQTRPDRMNPAVRSSFKGLEMFHDVTIKDWKNPTAYGLGKIFKEEKR